MAPLIVTFKKMHSLVKFTKPSTQPQNAPKRLCSQVMSKDSISFEIVELFLRRMPIAPGQLDASEGKYCGWKFTA